MSDETVEKVRFSRGQKFRLSPKGIEAKEAYTLMIKEAQSGTGRAQFDAARPAGVRPAGSTPRTGSSSWSSEREIEPFRRRCSTSMGVALPRRRSRRPSSGCSRAE